MKDYTNIINELEWKAISTRDAMESLLSVIRKDVEAEIERLKEENKTLLRARSIMESEIQSLKGGALDNAYTWREEVTIEEPMPKPDSERLWEAMLKLSTPLMYKGEVHFPDKKLIKETAMDILTVWKEATK